MTTFKLGVCLAFFAAALSFFLFSTDGASSQAGGSSLSAPTGVDASDNAYNSKVGLYWDTIRGATLYRIFRNTTNDSSTAADVGTTVSNNFFDVGAPAGQTLYYWVRAENGSIVSPLSVSDAGSRAATANQGNFTPLQPPPVPPGNPITATKIALGKTLFWDEQMSSTRTVACGTCHHASAGGNDPRSFINIAGSTNPGPDGILNTNDDILGSMGVPANNADGSYLNIATYGLNAQVTGRRSMSYIDAGYSPSLFWDGRATSIFRDPITNEVILPNGGALESQVLGPPLSTGEMAHGGRNWLDVAARMAASKPLALSPSVPQPMIDWIGGRSYPELFSEAFGSPEVTPARIAMAIATFERSLYSDRTPIDQAAQGIAALTEQEQRGRAIFNSPANNCGTCHGGNRLTDNAFHYIGVRPDTDDIGHEQVTGFPNDRGAFRTPNLRNLELRRSYFHNGRFTTIEEVVDFYDRGGDFDANNKPNLIHVLGLTTQQKADLVAFLKRPLTDPRVAAESERFTRPGLYSESTRVPQITGTGRAGSGGLTPQVYAVSPPIAGNPQFTISVNKALGASSAVLVINEYDPGVGSAIPAAGSFARIVANTQNTGTGNGWASVSVPIPNDPTLVGRTFYARWYVPDPGADSGFSASQCAKFTIFGDAAAPSRAKFVDFDGDGRTDISVFRPDNGVWYVLNSSGGTLTAQQFGISNDILVPGDYDADGKTDAAVYRGGVWYLSRSRDGLRVEQFGLDGDIPQAGDYDGDGREDLAVFRPSNGTWYFQMSRDGFAAEQFGSAGDKAVAADFDGDGKTDIAVYRSGVWWIRNSGSGLQVVSFGLADDRPVTSDYDGDGKSDIAVWRPSSGAWYRISSGDGTVSVTNYGLPTDLPAMGDYDGDGKSDLTVFRPGGGTWFSQISSGSERILQFGLNGDRPVPAAFVP